MTRRPDRRAYRDAPFLDELAESERRRREEPRGFAGLLRWFLEGFWAETPEAVHATGAWFGRPARVDATGQPVEDLASYEPPATPDADPVVISHAGDLTGGSQLGAPRQAEPFRQLLENSPRQTAGDGADEHYVRPMRAALIRLNGREEGALTARFLLQVAYAQGDWEAVAARWFPLHEFHQDESPCRCFLVRRPFAEHALHRLFQVHRLEPPARPVPRSEVTSSPTAWWRPTAGGPGWVSMSDSQRAAIDAAEKGVA